MLQMMLTKTSHLVIFLLLKNINSTGLRSKATKPFGKYCFNLENGQGGQGLNFFQHKLENIIFHFLLWLNKILKKKKLTKVGINLKGTSNSNKTSLPVPHTKDLPPYVAQATLKPQAMILWLQLPMCERYKHQLLDLTPNFLSSFYMSRFCSCCCRQTPSLNDI